VEACHVEHVAQKARREVEAKTKKEAKKWRITEKKKLEYIQRLWDEVVKEEATLSEGAEESQVSGSKHKEVTTGDKEGQQPSKKARRKYRGGATVKMRGANPCERYISTRQDCLVHSSR